MMSQTVYDVPIADKRVGIKPTQNVNGVFFQQWMAGRKKEEDLYMAEFNKQRIMNQTIWAKNSGAEMVLLNWQTLAPVPANKVPIASRWDDAITLAKTIKTIRENGIPKVWVYGLRIWNFPVNHISPQQLWYIYEQAGVNPDGITYSVFSEQDAMDQKRIIDKIRTIAPSLGIAAVHTGQSAFIKRAIQLSGVDEVLWYRP